MRQQVLYRKAQAGYGTDSYAPPKLNTPNTSYSDWNSGGSKGSSNNYGLNAQEKPFKADPGTATKPGEKGPKLSGAGYAQLAGAAVDMAKPFIEEWDRKKAKKKMDAGFKNAGLKNNEEMEKYGKEVNDTMAAVGEMSYGNLYGAMEQGGNTGRGLLYKKAKNGAEIDVKKKLKKAEREKRKTIKAEDKDFEKQRKENSKGRKKWPSASF